MGRSKDAAHGFFISPSLRAMATAVALALLIGGTVIMIIVMKRNATDAQVDRVVEWIESVGYRAHLSRGTEKTIIGAVGDARGREQIKSVGHLPGVESVVPILKPYKLASREFREEDTVVRVGALGIGDGTFIVMAGPCAVETEEQLMECAWVAKKAGAHILRGGAFKPRTSPYSFQGLEEAGLKLLKMVRERTGLPVVTEVVNPADVDLVEAYADILQIGARNVQNFALLKRVGQARKPVLLKRGMMTTIEELLMSAEYILSEGNADVILCERGIRTFETATRNTLDLSAVVVLKQLSHLPVIVDPSHAAGHWKYVTPLARAAMAVGADGIIVEVHPEPEKAVSDGMQSLKPEKFYRLMEDLGILGKAMREMGGHA